MFRHNTKIKFSKFKTEVPIIKMSLQNGAILNAIIDTGSESTVIDKKFVDNNQDMFMILSDNVISLIGVSGDTVNTSKDVVATFRIGSETSPIPCVTYDLSELNNHIHTSCDENLDVSMILGCDMLKLLDAVINIKEKSIKIRI